MDLQVKRTLDFCVLHVWPVQTLLDERSGPFCPRWNARKLPRSSPGNKAQRKHLAAKLDGLLRFGAALEKSGENALAAEMDGRVKQVRAQMGVLLSAPERSRKARKSVKESLRLKESAQAALAVAQQACREASIDCEEDGKRKTEERGPRRGSPAVQKKASEPLTTVNSRWVLLVPHIAKAYARVVRAPMVDKFNEVALPVQLGGRAGMTPEFAAQSSRQFMRMLRRRGRAVVALHIDLSAAFHRCLNELVSGPLTSHENGHELDMSLLRWSPEEPPSPHVDLTPKLCPDCGMAFNKEVQPHWHRVHGHRIAARFFAEQDGRCPAC